MRQVIERKCNRKDEGRTLWDKETERIVIFLGFLGVGRALG
jgi:hypothetical protein